MNEIIITLQELKITSYLFDKISNQDNVYRNFLLSEKKAQDIIILLRSWGCRQFKKTDNALAVNSLHEWFNENERLLPNDNKNLAYTSRNNIMSFEPLFDSLAECRASRFKRFGSVGAAKTLFFLRSKMFPPWDGNINNDQDLPKTGLGYCQYLLRVKEALLKLEDECLTKKITLKSISKLLGREHVSTVKLVDEYLYLKITRGYDPVEIIKIARSKNKFLLFS